MQVKSTSVTAAERRSWSYWSADGLPNLVAGFGCLLLALFTVEIRHNSRIPHASRNPVGIAAGFIAFGLYLLIVLSHRQILEWFKTRITYPRTGYVTPPYFTEDNPVPIDFVSLSLQETDAKRAEEVQRMREDHKRRALLAAALVIGAAAITGVAENRWICVVGGVVVALLFWLAGRKDERLSSVFLIGFPGAAIYLTIFRSEQMGYFLAGAGLLFVVQGTIALVRYLRRHPRIEA